MQIRRIWEFLGIRMTRTLQHSKQRKGRPQPANFQADQWTAFFVPPVHIGGYACFVSQSLLVLVIALSMPFSYTCLAISGKENDTMPATKNLCAQISLELHQKISDAREESGLTTAQYITNLLIEYYEMKENGGKTTIAVLQLGGEVFLVDAGQVDVQLVALVALLDVRVHHAALWIPVGSGGYPVGRACWRWTVRRDLFDNFRRFLEKDFQ